MPTPEPFTVDADVADLLRPRPQERLFAFVDRWRAVPRSSLGLTSLVIPLVVGLLLVGGLWWLLRPASAPIETSIPLAAASEGGSSVVGSSSGGEPTASGPAAGGDGVPTSAAAPVVVQAAGAVVVPGVYRLAPGSRVDDLVRRAGGLTPDADVDRVNLAALVGDGERVWVPRRGEDAVPPVVAGTGTGVVAGGGHPGGSTGTGTDGTPSTASPVDLNTATAEQLDELPGVGPATAAAILAYRDANGPFRSVEDLLEVRGIGDAKLDQLRSLVRV